MYAIIKPINLQLLQKETYSHTLDWKESQYFTSKLIKHHKTLLLWDEKGDSLLGLQEPD